MGSTSAATPNKMIILLLLACTQHAASALDLKHGAYEDLVVTVSDSVPVTNCKTILSNLEATLASASQYLFSALDGRAFLRTATVILPPEWPDNCVSKPVVSGSGELADVTIQPTGPARGRVFTQQSAGCGKKGDQIYLGFESLLRRDDTLARSFIKEFAKYRYGVFDEQGYFEDPVYPMCYHDSSSLKPKITGCSDLPIIDDDLCSGASTNFNLSKMVDDKARSSLMFAAEAPSVSMFCDEGTHDRYAPTKHNALCDRRSTFEIVVGHNDFRSAHVGSNENSQIQNTTPRITFKKQNTTRFVVVVENTSEMLLRESWKYLRFSIRKMALYDLPEDVEVGLVVTNETSSVELLNLVPLRGKVHNRDQLSAAVPLAPADTTQSPCLHCALRQAIGMLNERTKRYGPASNVIIVIAPGMNTNADLDSLIKEARKSKVKLETINYPEVSRTHNLDVLAERTGGEAYTVSEMKVNVDTSTMTTYFQLSNVLYKIIEKYCVAGNLPMEIHRREIRNDGRNVITGSFMLDSNMGAPAHFLFFTHDIDAPLVKSMALRSPSGEVYTRRSDVFVSVRILSLTVNITEPGTWTYTIEPFVGNPQPHYLQVMATPKSRAAPVVRSRFWITRNNPQSPLTLYAEVKRGDFPVADCKVEVLATKLEANGSVLYRETFELLDTGSGDPDIMKGDGVYSRYFTAIAGGAGSYTFEVNMSDNGNRAYSWTDDAIKSEDGNCCGSRIRTSDVELINPFQRYLPTKTIDITTDEIIAANQMPVGRIGDLYVEVKAEDMKAFLTWTAPDMGGYNVARYDIKFANSVEEIVDKFEMSATHWDARNVVVPPVRTGTQATFIIDMSHERDLLDKQLFFAIRPYAQMASDAKPAAISNWVRVLVPSPPPPPTVVPSYTTNESSWPFNTKDAGDNAGPSVSKAMDIGLEIILPASVAILFLVVLISFYVYMCLIKRRTVGSHKANKSTQMKVDKLNSPITIVPSSSNNAPQSPQQDVYPIDYPDPHTVGVPVSNFGYEEEQKKRYSLVHQQEQQLIEELKQQQMQRELNMSGGNFGGLSVISTNTTLQRSNIGSGGDLSAGHTLSPYNSWSASQLLHEHERRQSPMENMLQDEQMHHQDAMSQLDHMSITGHNSEHFVPTQYSPPVPPLPVFSPEDYPSNYNIYGVHQPIPGMSQQGAHPIYQTMQRNDAHVAFASSLQGSMSSVNSGEKKRRNVTMV